MKANFLEWRTKLSPDDCRSRIAAASAGSTEFVGWDLLSQIEIVDSGDHFELRHRIEPAVLTGTFSTATAGSIIRGEIHVPGQPIYRFAAAFAASIALLLCGASAYDLVFGTHLLRTRNRWDLGPGHPATPEMHLAVFILVPLVVIPMLALLWPKARPVKAEIRHLFAECAKKLFEAT